MEFIAPRNAIDIPEKDLPNVDDLPKNNNKRGFSSGSHGNLTSNRYVLRWEID